MQSSTGELLDKVGRPDDEGADGNSGRNEPKHAISHDASVITMSTGAKGAFWPDRPCLACSSSRVGYKSGDEATRGTVVRW